jgi:hypothetical protein
MSTGEESTSKSSYYRLMLYAAFYDEGTHIVVAHKINFDMLKMINDIEFVERIRGTYAGGGLASIGPVYD